MRKEQPSGSEKDMEVLEYMNHKNFSGIPNWTPRLLFLCNIMKPLHFCL